MKKSHICMYLFLFSLLVSASPALLAQQMYKWTDENGVVHFSETPPPEQQAEVTDIPPGAAPMGQQAPASGEAEDLPAAGTSAAQQRRDEIAARAELARAEEEAYRAQCPSQRDIVEQLEPHRRVYYQNEDGETVRMDDVERVNKVAEAKEFIARHCN